MAKLLWISDAGRTTGFSTVTHAIGERLAAMGHEVHVLAVGWDAKYPVAGPLKLYRAQAGDPPDYLGLSRTLELVDYVQPDLVVTVEDPAMVWRRFMDNRFDPEKKVLKRQPIVSYLPIDGYGMPQQWEQLKKLVRVVPYSRFGAEMLGIDPEEAIPHGVEPVWRPYSKAARLTARAALGIDPDAFVIGRVDTNSGRKDFSSTWKTINMALEEGWLPADKTVALFHTKLVDTMVGVNLRSLITRGAGKWMITNEMGWPVEKVVELVNCFDVTLSTSMGEGWGLNLVESLACGVPVIATDCSAIPEAVGPGGVLVEGRAEVTNPYGVDTILSDPLQMALELAKMYRGPKYRQGLGEKGRQHVAQFDWDTSARRFAAVIDEELAKAA
jgi:glycosyltransferase involved in cell wall biosynthesis